MRGQTIYLSGPITGLPIRYVKDRFKKAELAIYKQALLSVFMPPYGRAVDTKVINPIMISDWDLSWDSYMQISRAVLNDPSVSAMCLMKGWEKSEGCKMEVLWARTNGIPIYPEKGALAPW